MDFYEQIGLEDPVQKLPAQVLSMGDIWACRQVFPPEKAAVLMATKRRAKDGICAVCISPARTKTKKRKRLYPNEDQNTLPDPDDSARVMYNAVIRKYPSGTHLVIRTQNVQDILAA